MSCLIEVWGRDLWLSSNGVVFCYVFIIDGGVYRGLSGEVG